MRVSSAYRVITGFLPEYWRQQIRFIKKDSVKYYFKVSSLTIYCIPYSSCLKITIQWHFWKKILLVKKSTIPGAGKGLFTNKFIPKGSRIAEYKGKISTWKDVDHCKGLNAYIYYINRHHVIDASKHKNNFARYANDAKGSREWS